MTDSKNKYILSPSELAELVGKSQAAISKALKEKQTIPLNGRRVGIPNEVVREYLSNVGADFSFRIIAHLNLRGGCSKTSSTINMASRAYQYGHKVCILDLDSQASASLAFNATPKDDDSIFLNLWNSPENLEDALVKIEDGFSILPSSLDNGLLDSSLSKPQDQKFAVANVCKKLKELGYTLIVIDCSPSLGAAVVSSIAAADTIVIPVSGDIFSVKGLRLTLDEIKSVSNV